MPRAAIPYHHAARGCNHLHGLAVCVRGRHAARALESTSNLSEAPPEKFSCVHLDLEAPLEIKMWSGLVV